MTNTESRRSDRSRVSTSMATDGVSKTSTTSRRVGACNHCYVRKSRCDQGNPCQTCIKHGTQASCSGSGGNNGGALSGQRARGREASEKPRRSSESQPMQRKSPGSATAGRKACVRCARRKVRCDRAIPCGTCTRLGLSHTCRQEEESEMINMLKAESSALLMQKPAPIVPPPSESWSPSYPAMMADWFGDQEMKPMPMLFDDDQVEVLDARLSTSTWSGGESPSGLHPGSSSDGPSSSTPSSASGQSVILSHSQVSGRQQPADPTVRILLATDDAQEALACFGNLEIASRWPVVDEDVVEQLRDDIATHSIYGLSDLDLTFAYALLAFSCVTVVTHHPLRQPGHSLDKLMMKQYIAEAERFLAAYHDDQASTTQHQQRSSPERIGGSAFEGAPASVCRIHFLLVWTLVHSRKLKRARHHLRSAVRVGKQCGLYSAGHSALSMSKEAFRKSLVMELDMADVWICAATGTLSSVPEMPTDVRDYITYLVTYSPIQTRPWRIWLLHIAKWARRAALFAKETGVIGFGTLNDVADGEETGVRYSPYQLVQTDERGCLPAARCDQALAMLSEMECAELDIFVPGHFPPPLEWDMSLDSVAGMAVTLSQSAAPMQVQDAEALPTHMRELALSVRYTTLMTKAMLTGGALDAAQLNMPLCSVALSTAHEILAGVPLVLQHARFPLASRFMTDWAIGLIDVGAGMVYSAMNRALELPSAQLRAGVDRLFSVFPSIFDVLNAHCAATPMTLQVAMMSKPLAVPECRTIEAAGTEEEEYPRWQEWQR